MLSLSAARVGKCTNKSASNRLSGDSQCEPARAIAAHFRSSVVPGNGNLDAFNRCTTLIHDDAVDSLTICQRTCRSGCDCCFVVTAFGDLSPVRRYLIGWAAARNGTARRAGLLSSYFPRNNSTDSNKYDT